MLRLGNNSFVDSGKVSRISTNTKKEIILTLSDSDTLPKCFSSNYTTEEIAIIVQEAAKDVVNGGVRLINGIIDLVGEHLKTPKPAGE